MGLIPVNPFTDSARGPAIRIVKAILPKHVVARLYLMSTILLALIPSEPPSCPLLESGLH